MTMPIWRFEVSFETGQETVAERTQAVAGAFMPSVDRVGREFPLTIVSAGNTGGGTPAEDWYAGVEHILLSVLREDAAFEVFQSDVANLAIPAGDAAQAVRKGTPLAAAEDAEVVKVSNFWCRAGGRDFAFQCAGLPGASAFRRLILPEQEDRGEHTDDAAGSIHGRYHPEDHRT